jgi:hypothetical protein
MGNKSDPTKDPEFQKVVRHFLTTAPQLHKPAAKPKKARKHAASAKSKSGAPSA